MTDLGFHFFAPKPDIAELVIKFLPNIVDFYPQINPKIPLLLNVVTSITVDHLHYQIQTATKIPVNRILLVYCGAMLTTTVPLECFEVITHSETIKDIVIKEDNILFKPRIYLSIRPNTEPEVFTSRPHSGTSSPNGHHSHNSSFLVDEHAKVRLTFHHSLFTNDSQNSTYYINSFSIVGNG